MSPEILRGETATTTSDVFSLGVFLYELFAGRHPFAAETPLDVLEAIECRAVVSAAAMRPGVPPGVDRLILRMLDREPDRRPSASEVWEALSQER
jgi:serine/threonine-protein kinase